jgi:hypothetical protein
MMTGFFVALAGLAAAMFWLHRKSENPVYLLELTMALNLAAGALRRNGAEAEASNLERIALSVDEARCACIRKDVVAASRVVELNRDVLAATNDDVLARANLWDRRARTKEALYATSKKLVKLAR